MQDSLSCMYGYTKHKRYVYHRGTENTERGEKSLRELRGKYGVCG
jgi:hypothetical protein